MNINRNINRLVRNSVRAALERPLLGALALIIVLAPVVHGQDRPRDFVSTLLTPQGPGVELGVSLREVTAEDVKTRKLKAETGALVERVDSAGPAAKAGFRAGDVVLSFDGENVRSARQLGRLIADTPAGREVAATVWRDGKEVELEVAPEPQGAWARRLRIEPPEVRRFVTPQFPVFEPDRFYWEAPSYVLRHEGGRFVFGQAGLRLGAGLQDLTDQLSDYFGTNGGALVTSVEDKSAGQAAGLRAGDVITKINDQNVRTTADLRRLLNNVTGEVTITVMRDRKELTLKTKVDEPVDAPRRRVR
jgi:serine protease Do